MPEPKPIIVNVDAGEAIALACQAAVDAIDQGRMDRARQLVAQAGTAAGALVEDQQWLGSSALDRYATETRQQALAALDAAEAAETTAERDQHLAAARHLNSAADRLAILVAGPAVEETLPVLPDAAALVDLCATRAGAGDLVKVLIETTRDGSLEMALVGLSNDDAVVLARILARTRS